MKGRLNTKIIKARDNRITAQRRLYRSLVIEVRVRRLQLRLSDVTNSDTVRLMSVLQRVGLRFTDLRNLIK